MSLRADGPDHDGKDRQTVDDEPLVARRSVLSAAGMLVGGSLFDSTSFGQADRGSTSQQIQQTSSMSTVSIIGSGKKVEYALAVSGELSKSSALGASVDGGDTVSSDRTTASGWVGGGTDSYAFTGEMTDFAVSDPGAVTVVVSPGSGDEGERQPADGTVVALPGDLQATIDAASDDVRGDDSQFNTIRLDPTQVYERREPLELREGVRVKANGAELRITEDIDAVRVHSRSELHYPAINYTGDTLSADKAAFVFDGSDGPFGWSALSNPLVYGARVSGVPHGGGRTTEGSAVRLRSRDGHAIAGVNVLNLTAMNFRQVWEIHSGDSEADGDWINSNRVTGQFGRVDQAAHFHGANRMTDNQFMGWYQNGWMSDRFLTLSGDARANWFVGTWWDLYRANEVKAGGSAFHFGPDTRRNVSVSLVPYRDWPDPLPINDHGRENKVIDQHALRAVLGEHAL